MVVADAVVNWKLPVGLAAVTTFLLLIGSGFAFMAADLPEAPYICMLDVNSVSCL